MSLSRGKLDLIECRVYTNITWTHMIPFLIPGLIWVSTGVHKTCLVGRREIYSAFHCISHPLCTRLCFVSLFCLNHNLKWLIVIYPHPSGLLHGNWNNRMIVQCQGNDPEWCGKLEFQEQELVWPVFMHGVYFLRNCGIFINIIVGNQTIYITWKRWLLFGKWSWLKISRSVTGDVFFSLL